jgi:predicted TPR repeat methyltransferase
MTQDTLTDSDLAEPIAETELSFSDAIAYAMKLLQTGRLEGAVELGQRLQELAPGHPDVLHLLGMARHRMGRAADAVELLQSAIAAEPSFAGFHNNLGNILMQQGRLEEATQAYEQAQVLTPDSPDLLSNLGALYKAMRRFDEARVLLERAIALDERHINAHNNMGLLYAELGDRPKAVAYYVRSLELMPGHAQARKLLGSTYYALGRIQDAAEVYRQWLDMEPDNPAARHLYAASTGEGVPERARDDYVEQTFDGFAASFESVLNERLLYQAPQLCGELLARLLPPPVKQFVMLDAGAGTGLCGPLMAPWARVLAGVDLSKGMLDIAQTKGVYTDLYKAELTEFFKLSPGQWDVVVSADTLCYFGDLTEVTAAAAQSLKPGGLLVYTVESLPTDSMALHQIQPHGRYAHHADHIVAALSKAGMALVQREAVVLRQEGGLPVNGWLVAARAGTGIA